jgi:hypothetical protein
MSAVGQMAFRSDCQCAVTFQRLPYGYEMTAAGQFIAALQTELRVGNVSYETEQHLKHEFRKLGWGASVPMLAAAVDAEIERLDSQAATLRRLRAGLTDVR